MRITKRQLRNIIKEAAGETLVPEIQTYVDDNQFLKGSVVSPADLIETSDYVIYASGEGLKHTKDRHTDANAPGSLIHSDVDLKGLIMALASTPPTSSGGMVKWEGVQSPTGPIGEMGLATASPEEIANMKDYTMPGGRGEAVKVGPGQRKPTDQVTLVTAELGELADGRTALSLVTLYPGGMDVDGVTVPNDRNAFADAGIYFVLPPESPALKEGKTMKITRRQLRKIIKEVTIGPDGAGIPTGGRMTTRGPGPGPFAEVWPYFEERGEGWKWKTKSSDEGLAFLPIHGSEDLGYYVKIEHQMGTYNMSWTKRIELPGRQVKVISPQNGWTVGSVPNEIKTAVDEINYDITKHESTTDQVGMK